MPRYTRQLTGSNFKTETSTPTPLFNPFALAPQRLAQIINPLNWMASGTGQVGLINISGAASAKPEVEAEIVENVATYGRQLGRISDLLQEFLKHLHADAWDGHAGETVRAFREMNAKIAAVKAGYLAPTQQNVDQLIAGINSLKETDRDEYVRIRNELRRKLFDDEKR